MQRNGIWNGLDTPGNDHLRVLRTAECRRSALLWPFAYYFHPPRKALTAKANRLTDRLNAIKEKARPILTPMVAWIVLSSSESNRLWRPQVIDNSHQRTLK